MGQLKSSRILIADDDADDQLMLKEAFRELDMEKVVDIVNDGQEVLDYLTQHGKFENKHLLPRIILLDLNMPRKDGREVLATIKSLPVLNKIPVIVFSTSSHAEDISSVYDLGANSYICKPNTYNELLKIATAIKQYWINTVQVPALHI